MCKLGQFTDINLARRLFTCLLDKSQQYWFLITCKLIFSLSTFYRMAAPRFSLKVNGAEMACAALRRLHKRQLYNI